MCLEFELLNANKVTLTEINAITIDTTSESMWKLSATNAIEFVT